MDTFTKQPSEKQTRAMNYTARLPQGAATLSSATVAAYDDAGTNVSATILVSTTCTLSADSLSALFRVQAGTDGEDYKITVTATLNNTDILEDDVLMKVRAV